MSKVVVVEANEVPMRLLRWYAEARPGSAIAEILATGAVGETEVREELPRELYPSQTWASLATGVPYQDHHVYWYGDPKPDRYPLYWQVAARSRRVGVVGVLHSSPFDLQCDRPGLVFALPDAFAPDDGARPDRLRALQGFNLAMTRANARAVASSRPGRHLVPGARAAAAAGLRPASAASLAALVAGVAAGRIPRERLRGAQFTVLADVFASLARSHDPDLAVLFTNHVAAAMHRYWYASFPHDWDEALYDDAWVERHRAEIPAALTLLDRNLARLGRWCRTTGRTLVVLSSMGQEGGQPPGDRPSHDLVVTDPARFATALGVTAPFRDHRAMVPHLTLEFDDAATAAVEARRLATRALAGPALTVDRNDRTVTCTYHLAPDPDRFVVDGRALPVAEAGLSAVAVDAHRCGTHHPRGVALVVGSSTAALPAEPFDYLEVAPALLIALGVEPEAHHRTPSVRF